MTPSHFIALILTSHNNCYLSLYPGILCPYIIRKPKTPCIRLPTPPPPIKPPIRQSHYHAQQRPLVPVLTPHAPASREEAGQHCAFLAAPEPRPPHVKRLRQLHRVLEGFVLSVTVSEACSFVISRYPSQKNQAATKHCSSIEWG